MKFNQMTNYPNKYKKTYWGNFDEKSLDKINDEIIENRNQFIPTYSITKHCYMKPYNLSQIIEGLRKFIHIDHPELYYSNTKKEYILIISLYRQYYHPTPEIYEKYGFTKINQMYANDALTYVKIIPK